MTRVVINSQLNRLTPIDLIGELVPDRNYGERFYCSNNCIFHCDDSEVNQENP